MSVLGVKGLTQKTNTILFNFTTTHCTKTIKVNLNIYKPMMINNEIFVRMVSCGRCLEITLVQVLGECRWQRFFFQSNSFSNWKTENEIGD